MKIEQDILFGKEGFLFLYNGGHKQFDFLTKRIVPNEASRTNFFNNIKSRARYCLSEGIGFLHVVFPSKPVVMADFLPMNVGQIESLYRSEYERFFRDDELSEKILFPDELLQSVLRSGRKPYFRQDTHLADFGKLAIYHDICKRFGFEERDFTFNERVFKGDLAGRLGLEGVVESFFVVDDNFFIFDNRSSLPGNTDNVVIVKNLDLSDGPRLLVFGDSFWKDMLPLFAQNFQEILYIRSPSFHKEIVPFFKPDFIFTGNAERYLSSVSCDEKRHNVLVKHYGDSNYSPKGDFVSAFKAVLSIGYDLANYRAWSESLGSGITLDCLVASDLRDVEFKQENGSSVIRSLSSDPQIIFDDLKFKKRQYVLNVSLYSDSDTIFQVFFSPSGVPDFKFSEGASRTHQIKSGYNKFSIVLPERRLGSRLRIDPLRCEGEMILYSLNLVPNDAVNDKNFRNKVRV